MTAEEVNALERLRAFKVLYDAAPQYAHVTEELLDALDLLAMYEALAAQHAALEIAAWDLHEAASDALDAPEDADSREIRKRLAAMGERLPARRPGDVETTENE
jgi:hypothetical protein